MKRTRLRPVSRKRARRDRSYPAARQEVWVRGDGLCEAPATPDGLLCGNEMVDVHHIAGRGGRDPHRLDNLVGLCRWHHDYVHAHPEWACEVGLMRSRHGGDAA